MSPRIACILVVLRLLWPCLPVRVVSSDGRGKVWILQACSRRDTTITRMGMMSGCTCGGLDCECEFTSVDSVRIQSYKQYSHSHFSPFVAMSCGCTVLCILPAATATETPRHLTVRRCEVLHLLRYLLVALMSNQPSADHSAVAAVASAGFRVQFDTTGAAPTQATDPVVRIPNSRNRKPMVYYVLYSTT